jgi:endonuclease YncB( thermonuclease family)
MKTESQKIYQETAEAAARYAHIGMFSFERGVLPSDSHMAVAFDARCGFEHLERLREALKNDYSIECRGWSQGDGNSAAAVFYIAGTAVTPFLVGVLLDEIASPFCPKPRLSPSNAKLGGHNG